MEYVDLPTTFYVSYLTSAFSLPHSVPVSLVPLKFRKPTSHASNSGPWYLPQAWLVMIFPETAVCLTHSLHICTHLSPLNKAFTNDPMQTAILFPSLCFSFLLGIYHHLTC